MTTRQMTADEVEVARIVALPFTYDPPPEVIDEVSRVVLSAEAYGAGKRLYRPQVNGILQREMASGLFAPIGVGWGKTLLSIYLAQRAIERGAGHVALFVPPANYSQLFAVELPKVRRMVDLHIDIFGMGQKSRASRMAMAITRRRGLYVLPYSYLQVADTSELLNRLNPDEVILDECHNVKNKSSARTKRIFTFLSDHPQCALSCMSGTITQKGLNDFSHLLWRALGTGAPIPLNASLCEGWGEVLDAVPTGEGRAGSVQPLVDWARSIYGDHERLTDDLSGFRYAFRLRMVSAPGVAATSDEDIGVGLTFHNYPATQPPRDKLKDLIHQVVYDNLTPSGDQIDWGFHKWKYLFELSFGFYFNLKWPDAATMAEQRNISEDEALEMLHDAQEAHTYQQNYHSLLRRWFETRHMPGLDTPLLVGSHFAREQGPGQTASMQLYEAWHDWRSRVRPELPERESIPVFIDDYKVNHIEQWAQTLPRKSPRAIIWYYHRPVGEWIVHVLKHAGHNVSHYPAGAASNKALVAPAAADTIAVASMKAHGTGKNLQHFTHTLFAQFPRQASLAQQVIGRNHRNGQTEDELTMVTIHTLDFDHELFAACLVDSIYQHQVVGARQRLCCASFVPLPRTYPPEWIQERYLTQPLGAEERAAYFQFFGDGS